MRLKRADPRRCSWGRAGRGRAAAKGAGASEIELAVPVAEAGEVGDRSARSSRPSCALTALIRSTAGLSRGVAHAPCLAGARQALQATNNR